MGFYDQVRPSDTKSLFFANVSGWFIGSRLRYFLCLTSNMVYAIAFCLITHINHIFLPSIHGDYVSRTCHAVDRSLTL